MIECAGCGSIDVPAPEHPAHVLAWQVGGVWVPICSDRVLDWWATDATAAIRDRVGAGAPGRWLRPLQ